MEIERKFLVNNIPFDLSNLTKLEIQQCYISFSPVIRIRKQNLQYFLTVKGKGTISRVEHELEINKNQYKELLKKISGKIIEKNRYLYPLSHGLTAEIDIFSGFLKGLKFVEVEFKSVEESQNFIPPFWFSKEVTEDVSFTNSELAKN